MYMSLILVLCFYQAKEQLSPKDPYSYYYKILSFSKVLSKTELLRNGYIFSRT